MLTTLRYSNDNGYVLIIVLGLLMALSIMAMSLGAAVRSDLAQTRWLQDETAAEFLAKGGIEWAIHYLNTLERHNTLWQAAWQSQSAVFQRRSLGAGTFDLTYQDATGTLRYGLQDEEARVNLNRAPSTLLAALPGLTVDIAAAIVTHRQQQPWETPEALVTRGLVTAALLYGTEAQPGLAAYVTVWGSGKININTAPLQVLTTLPGLTPAIATALLHHRQGPDQQPGTGDDRPFRDPAELLQVPGVTPADLTQFVAFITVVPTVFRGIITGRVANPQRGERVYRRLAVIDRTSRPVQVRYWQSIE
jgi:type II secretory pathway component PulK